MDLNKYKELTGAKVPTSQEAKVNATIRRMKSKLETLLGYTLKPKNLNTELGKVQFEGYYPSKDLSNLLDPDEEQGRTKLFDYHEKDLNLHIDPFKNVYSVKLVLPQDNGDFITVVELDNVVAQYMGNGIGKYIKKYDQWFDWAWYNSYKVSWKANVDSGLQLAIDADWMTCYPEDIMYLWADMVEYYSNPNLGKKSESVDGHSWSNSDTTSPELRDENKLLLVRYAGPNGLIARNPVSDK